MAKIPEIPLPRDWSKVVKSGLLHAIALERTALLAVRAGFENSPDPRAELVAALDRALELLWTSEEQIRILSTRLEGISALKRPHYPPVQRLASSSCAPALAGRSPRPRAASASRRRRFEAG